MLTMSLKGMVGWSSRQASLTFPAASPMISNSRITASNTRSFLSNSSKESPAVYVQSCRWHREYAGGTRGHAPYTGIAVRNTSARRCGLMDAGVNRSTGAPSLCSSSSSMCAKSNKLTGVRNSTSRSISLSILAVPVACEPKSETRRIWSWCGTDWTARAMRRCKPLCRAFIDGDRLPRPRLAVHDHTTAVKRAHVGRG